MPTIRLSQNECVTPKTLRGVDNQYYLKAIADKGAPVVGDLHKLAYNPNYIYTHEFDDETRTLKVSWNERG